MSVDRQQFLAQVIAIAWEQLHLDQRTRSSRRAMPSVVRNAHAAFDSLSAAAVKVGDDVVTRQRLQQCYAAVREGWRQEKQSTAALAEGQTGPGDDCDVR